MYICKRMKKPKQISNCPLCNSPLELKQRAEKLVNRFLNKIDTYVHADGLGIYNEYEGARQCALVCVDERLKEIDEFFEKCDPIITNLWNHYVSKQRDWQLLKQEIEKL